MACSFTADYTELAWKASSFFQKGRKHPHALSHSLTGRRRTGWPSQNPKVPLSLNLNRNETRPCNAQAGRFRSLNNEGVPRSGIIGHAERGRIGFLSQTSDGLFALNLKGDTKQRRSRFVAQAGRSKSNPRISQPIRPRQRRRVKPPSGRQPDPAGNIRKPDHSKPREPYSRHPDDYYKFGPFGPYNYKAGVEGTLIPVTSLDQEYVFSWSTIKDLKEQEQVDIYDACVLYDNRVKTFDASLLQFFYVFVRVPFFIGPEPSWKQWTLVAEITVESGESLDTLSLLPRFADHIRNKITKYTGWFRPDLVYVKPSRRRYQVRFEPETEFIRKLETLLRESAGELHERDSYYGEFCQILGLDVNASHEEITSRYEDSSEEIKLACVEHLLSKHPVQLLPPMSYPNRAVWMAGQSSGEINKTSNTEHLASTEPHARMGEEEEKSNAVHYFEEEGSFESDEDEDVEEESEDWDDLDDPAIHARMRKSFSVLKDEESAMLDRLDADGDEGNATDLEDEEYAGKEGDAHAGDQGISDTRPFKVLKAAVRPYTYVNLIREMVMLREMVLHEKGSMQQIEPGQALL